MHAMQAYCMRVLTDFQTKSSIYGLAKNLLHLLSQPSQNSGKDGESSAKKKPKKLSEKVNDHNITMRNLIKCFCSNFEDNID